jgi:predicted phosphodiesterase
VRPDEGARVKLQVVSDLHLSVAALELAPTGADAIVLAGDIARPPAAIAWAAALGKPVLYVPGNHEFYGGSFEGTLAELKQLAAGTPVHVLDNAARVMGGVRFLGSTLWTDFRLFGTGPERSAAMREAVRFMRDFQRIERFTPEHSAALFARNAAWLAERLAEPFPGKTVVITHHAPSPKSIHPRFAASALNACFVSDAERLVDGRRCVLWIHGHTHDSFDYMLNGTRVLCNPRGYARNGVNENLLFDAGRVVEV